MLLVVSLPSQDVRRPPKFPSELTATNKPHAYVAISVHVHDAISVHVDDADEGHRCLAMALT